MNRIIHTSLIGAVALSAVVTAQTFVFLPTKTQHVTEQTWQEVKYIPANTSRMLHGKVIILDAKLNRSCLRSSEMQSEIDNILSSLTFGLGLTKEYLNSDKVGLSCAFTLNKTYLEYDKTKDDSNVTNLYDIIIGEDGNFDKDVFQLTNRLKELGVDINATELLEAPSK